METLFVFGPFMPTLTDRNSRHALFPKKKLKVCLFIFLLSFIERSYNITLAILMPQ